MRAIVGDVPLGGSPFPPIADYAFLSDCETCALVAPSGNVEWMCLPRVDGPSIFGAILDRDAGSFRLSPIDTSVPAGRRYIPGTIVMETTWGTRTGWIIVRDVLLIGPWHQDRERSNTHRRAPTDTDADHVLLRTLRCVNGRVEMDMECEPRLDYGRKAVRWEYDGPAYGAAVARADGEPTELRLTTDLRLGFEGGRARARCTMRDGDAPTGAMIAAATTSLPETPHGERNWDYRFAWIRDSTFMLWGLYTLGFDDEANDFFYFIRDVASGEDDLQIMYGIGGEKDLIHADHALAAAQPVLEDRPQEVAGA